MACKSTGAPECARQKALVAGLLPVRMQSMFEVSVEEVITEETTNEAAGASGAVVSKSPSDNLWVCQLRDIFVKASQFDNVVRILDNLSATLLNEAVFQHIQIDCTLCQVSFCFVFSMHFMP